jgi:ABC-2 type transport system permease protein
MRTTAAVAFRGEWGHFWATLFGAAAGHIKRSNAYLIDIVRWPLFPLMLYATWQIGYTVSGQPEVAGTNAAGFLLVGIVGLIVWTATIWSGGYAIEYERSGGTAAALFLSPASRVAVVAGYGVGGMVWLCPALAVVALLGLAVGARLHVTDLLALAAAICALLIGALAVGFALAGLFILSRRANLLANFLQQPVHLLAGFVVPRQDLPGWLQPLSDLLPASHAIDALRASSLRGAGLNEIGGSIMLALATSALFALIGIISLRQVEQAAKRAGHLDLY